MPPNHASARRWLAGVVVGVGVILAIGLTETARLHGRLRALRAENDRIRAELALLRPLEALRSDWFEEEAALRLRLGALTTLRAEGGQPLAVLGAVEVALPAGAWLTSFEWVGQTLDLRGRSEAPDGVADLMDGLQASPCFTDVALRRVAGAGAEQDFELAATVVTPCDGPPPGASDPFASPALAEATRPRREVPAVARWPAARYEVIVAEPGVSATLRDPEGGTHRVAVGDLVVDGRSAVAFITDTGVVLTEDRVVDVDTQRTETSILTLPRVAP